MKRDGKYIYEGGENMPKVGKKYFPYTKMGKKAARRYARKTGAKLHMHSKYSMRGKTY